jgi:hypothetical protein
VRNAGEGFVCGPVQLKRLGWTFAVCRVSAYGLPECDKHTGAAGAAFRPVFRTPSFQGKCTEMTGKPWGRSEHGAMTRVWMSAGVGLFDN